MAKHDGAIISQVIRIASLKDEENDVVSPGRRKTRINDIIEEFYEDGGEVLEAFLTNSY